MKLSSIPKQLNWQAGRVSLLFFLLLVLVVFSAAASAANLSADQQEIAERYQRLEAVALRIADLAEESDSDRAQQIRDAIGKARSVGIEERFDRVVALLETERLAEARSGQSEIAVQLETLLRLVLADPLESQLEEERRRLEKLSAGVRRAIRSQRSLRARIQREASQNEAEKLAEEQSQLADHIERLLELVPDESSAGKEGGEAPATDPAKGPPSLGGRMGQAEKSMRQASKQISSDKTSEAAEQQRKAQRELEAAQRLVEKALRQLREEEQQRRLASLSDRFREMLAEENEISQNAGELVAKNEKPQRARKIASAKLADRQARVAVLAGRTLRLIEEDGKSLIFAEAMRQATGDMRAVESRFRQTRLDSLTHRLAQDIVLTLEEMLAAVDQALDDLEQQRQNDQAGGPTGGGDPSLVGRLAELRMLRSVQARILRKIQLWEEATGPSEELETLAIQQQQLAEAARHAAQFEKPTKN